MTAKPWTTELDFYAWTSETGLPCRIIRHPTMKHLCGYVGVPLMHRWHGDNADTIAPQLDVHGHLTFADAQLKGQTRDSNWWIGFDCAHAGDIMPGMADILPSKLWLSTAGTYRDVDYVRGECERLAEQVKAAG